MKDEEINIAIAEALGWTEIGCCLSLNLIISITRNLSRKKQSRILSRAKAMLTYIPIPATIGNARALKQERL